MVVSIQYVTFANKKSSILYMKILGWMISQLLRKYVTDLCESRRSSYCMCWYVSAPWKCMTKPSAGRTVISPHTTLYIDFSQFCPNTVFA